MNLCVDNQPLMLAVQRAIDAHLVDPQFDAFALSKSMQINIDTLELHVHMERGCCLNDYIKLCRLRRAKSMLESGIGTIEDTSRACGFSNTKNFIKNFEKQFGVTPQLVLGESRDNLLMINRLINVI